MKRLKEQQNAATASIKNLKQAQKIAQQLRWDAVNNLDTYLLDFEENFSKRGGKVYWASEAQQAVEISMSLLNDFDSEHIAYDYRQETEELELRNALSSEGMNYSAIQPAIQISNLFERPFFQFQNPLLDIDEDVIKSRLEKETSSEKDDLTSLFEAHNSGRVDNNFDVYVGGVDFYVANWGALVINGHHQLTWKALNQCRKKIFIVGIERVLSSFEHLELYLKLSAAFEKGLARWPYQHYILGGNEERETHLIFLDNGRTDLLANKNLRAALYDLDGFSFSSCTAPFTESNYFHPVMKGVLGSVTAPVLYEDRPAKELAFAQPINNIASEHQYGLDINPLLLETRKLVAQTKTGPLKKLQKWHQTLLGKGIQGNLPQSIQQALLRKTLGPTWGKIREIPKFAAKTFQQQWQERS